MRARVARPPNPFPGDSAGLGRCPRFTRRASLHMRTWRDSPASRSAFCLPALLHPAIDDAGTRGLFRNATLALLTPVTFLCPILATVASPCTSRVHAWPRAAPSAPRCVTTKDVSDKASR